MLIFQLFQLPTLQLNICISAMALRSNAVIRGIRALIDQLKLRRKGTERFIGEDHLGNKYFEAEKFTSGRRFHRYYKRDDMVTTQDFEPVNYVKVPPAWDAWLRFRRSLPPTREEIEESENYFRHQQAMAEERSLEEAKISEASDKIDKPLKDIDESDMISNQAETEKSFSERKTLRRLYTDRKPQS